MTEADTFSEAIRQIGLLVNPNPIANMNCTHCDTELPHDAAFCSRCGNPTGNPPVFPPALPVRQSMGAGSGLLIGCVCAAGALMILLMIFMLVAIAMHGPPPGVGGGGVRCC